jgi:hypothetical protein
MGTTPTATITSIRWTEAAGSQRLVTSTTPYYTLVTDVDTTIPSDLDTLDVAEVRSSTEFDGQIAVLPTDMMAGWLSIRHEWEGLVSTQPTVRVFGFVKNNLDDRRKGITADVDGWWTSLPQRDTDNTLDAEFSAIAGTDGTTNFSEDKLFDLTGVSYVAVLPQTASSGDSTFANSNITGRIITTI